MIIMVVVELCVCMCTCMSVHACVCECVDWFVKRYYSILFLVYIMLVAKHFP